MIRSLFLSLLLLSPSAQAGLADRCATLNAQAAEIRALQPVACDESRETHATFMKALPEALELCKSVLAEALSGPTQLKLGTEDEMQKQAMEIKERHITEQSTQREHVIRELLPTPLDNNDLSRVIPKVGSECGSEIETHVSFRSSLLDALSAFQHKIQSDDDSLLQQAMERSLPDSQPSSLPKNVR